MSFSMKQKQTPRQTFPHNREQTCQGEGIEWDLGISKLVYTAEMNTAVQINYTST